MVEAGRCPVQCGPPVGGGVWDDCAGGGHCRQTRVRGGCHLQSGGAGAARLVKAVAQVVGGGKPTLAQAGGKDVSKVGDAL